MPIVYSYDCNKGKRNKNDDAVTAVKNKNGDSLAIICDGVGSHSNSAYSSNYIVSTLEKEWQDMTFANFNNMKNWLLEKIEKLNKELFERSKENNKKMGTTIVVAATCQDKVVVYNIGDSRCYAITKNDEINLLTVDDSFVNALIEAGAITLDEAKTHPERNTLIQAMATKETINAHSFTDDLSNYNYFLLCSDGLSNMIEEQEMKNIIEKEELSLTIKKLIDLAIERGGTDNISVVVLKILRGTNDDK